MAEGKKRVGVVLFQLGGPDSLDAVEPFLRNLFLDPDIIPMGPLGFLRGPLASYIAKKRAVPVAGRYAMIGRRSPIAILTERQLVKLSAALSSFIDPVVVTAMRYWKPFTQDAVVALKAAGPLDELVLLPLYPHYSYATTLSSMKEWRRVYGKPVGGPPEHAIESFYAHPSYIEAVVKKIGVCLRQFPDSSRIHLLFSAHGLPMSLVEKGDPYPRHIAETVRLVNESGRRQFSLGLIYRFRTVSMKSLNRACTRRCKQKRHNQQKREIKPLSHSITRPKFPQTSNPACSAPKK